MTNDKKNSLITGAGEGIGSAIAIELANRDVHVIITDKSLSNLTNTENTIIANGGTCTVVQLDMTDLLGIDNLGLEIFKRWGRLDFLIANAAILGTLSPLHHQSNEEFLEVLNVEPYGSIISKFDTGNSSLPVIHGDDIELKGKMVHWTCLGKRVKKPLVRVKKVNLGGLRDYSEERYTVNLDIEFAGTVYKDVEFTIDDRKKRTRILLNLSTLRLLNVIVNPQRKYVVTTKYVLDK